MSEVDSLDRPTQQLLEDCPFSPPDIRLSLTTMEDRKQALINLQQTLREEIATLANASSNSPELTAATDTNHRINKLLAALNDRQQILQERFENHPCSTYNLLKAHSDHLQAACQSARFELKKQVVPNRRAINALLVSLEKEQNEIHENMKSASHSEASSCLGIVLK